MGSTTPVLRCLDLTKDAKALEPGTQEWKQLCGSIRGALEEDGAFLVEYDKIPRELLNKIFSFMADIFNLPLETKCKNAMVDGSVNYTHAEPPGPAPYFETMGIVNPSAAREAQAFTQLMWPQGNHEFCKTLMSMSMRLRELFVIITKMIFDSYNVGTQIESQMGSLESFLRMTKYSGGEPAAGLRAHADVSYLSILFENDVEGLQLQSKQGDWFPVDLGKTNFIVFVGHAFAAWSNGRLYAVPHKVIYRGDKDRLSYGMFFIPNGDQILKAPDELIDEEHPPVFKPITFRELFQYTVLNNGAVDALQKVAGI